MKVYFVRHGHSALNDFKVHQPIDTPLSEKGFKQAELLAQRFTTIPIEIGITSTYTRAVQTAQAIEKALNIPFIKSDLLTERRMPAIFENKLFDDPETISIHNQMRENSEKPDWHYADEENFTDLINRIKAVFDLIHAQKKENILIVTHGYFLTLIITHMLFQENLTHKLFKSFNAELLNTGITLCEYKADKWKLLTWNDYAHLGELS